MVVNRLVSNGEAKLLQEFLLQIAMMPLDGEPEFNPSFTRAFRRSNNHAKTLANVVHLARQVAKNVGGPYVREEIGAIRDPKARAAWKKSANEFDGDPNDYSLWLLMKMAESR